MTYWARCLSRWQYSSPKSTATTWSILLCAPSVTQRHAGRTAIPIYNGSSRILLSPTYSARIRFRIADCAVAAHGCTHRRQIDRALAADIVVAGFAHDLARAPHHPPHPGFAHEHVMRFLGQHEARGARERIEAAFRQRQQLVFAVAIGESREHVERQPVFDGLVEGFQDARLVARAAAALQQLFALLAAVAPEIGMQQVDHGP